MGEYYISIITPAVYPDINECEVPNTCRENAECKDSDGSFSCECRPGYIEDEDNKCSGRSSTYYGGGEKQIVSVRTHTHTHTHHAHTTHARTHTHTHTHTCTHRYR